MTFKEAVAEASRRLGWSEDRIDSAFKQTSSLLPDSKGFEQQEIPEEILESLIQRMMTIIIAIETNPSEQRRVQEKINRIASNN